LPANAAEDYPYLWESDLPFRTSVSRIKKEQLQAMEDDVDERLFDAKPQYVQPPTRPGFMQDAQMENRPAYGAELGVMVHSVMMYLNFAAITDDAAANEKLIADACNRLKTAPNKPTERKIIGYVLPFLGTPLAKRMKAAQQAGTLKREQKFVTEQSACKLFDRYRDKPDEAQVLVQGVIDAYFIEGDEIVLVDYKTDKIPQGEDAAEYLDRTYGGQMMLYADALEQYSGKKVGERRIVSLRGR
jgi:ATP-dependent helicase/nuclease subunit A